MTAPTPPTPDDELPTESEDALIEAASSDAPMPEMDLSKEAIFESETPLGEEADELAGEPAAGTHERPVGPVFRASLTDAVWLLWRRVTGNPIEELGCRKCGYLARRLTKRVCPECGADFMQHGLIDPSDTRLGLVTLAIAWTLAILIAGISTRTLLQVYVLPKRVHRFVSLDFVELKPANEPHRLTLFGECTSNDRWPNDHSPLIDPITKMVVYLAPKETATVACDLDLTNSTYAFREGGRPLFSGYPTTGKLDDDAIATWILFCGIEAHRNEIDDQAAMAMAMIRLLKQPSSVLKNASRWGVNDTKLIRQIYVERSDSQLSPQYIPLAFLAWGTLWFLGTSCLMLLSRNRPALPATPPQKLNHAP